MAAIKIYFLHCCVKRHVSVLVSRNVMYAVTNGCSLHKNHPLMYNVCNVMYAFTNGCPLYKNHPLM